MIGSQNTLPLVFQLTNIIGQTILAKKLKELLDSYALKRKIIAYVKDERSNLNTMTTTLKSIVSCDMFGLEENFKAFVQGIHFIRLANMLQHMKKIAKTCDMC